MAEVLLRHRLDRLGVTATVSSAGVLPPGYPATSHAMAAMAARGLDLEAHRSRQFDSVMVRRADLVIGLAREHVREVVLVDPDALGRCFTLEEFVRAAEARGARDSGEPLDEWLTHLAARRRREDLIGIGHDDALDVRDPAGSTRADHDIAADEIDRLLERFVALVWPQSPGSCK